MPRRWGHGRRRGFRRWSCGVSLFPAQGRRYPLFRIIAKVDRKKCIGCKRCMERCPFGAIFMEDKKAQVNVAFCRGCGICTLVCPKGAISLEYIYLKTHNFQSQGSIEIEPKIQKV